MTLTRLRVEVRGAVQGVGFRPHVARLANQEGLSGWVGNGADGADLEVEGPVAAVKRFLARLTAELPLPGEITGLTQRQVPPLHELGFRIAASLSPDGPRRATVLPDLAPCALCLEELYNPGDHRYAYPFLSCTHCGPRYSIINGLPYDRSLTTMAKFTLCARCRREYCDIGDRRFHAQPIACASCGPRLHGSLAQAVETIRRGGIVALKGVGGFQLLADPTRADALARLRTLKARPHKPLALMVKDQDTLRRLCRVTDDELELLGSAAAPIVLLERQPGSQSLIDAQVAPGQERLGVMFCSSPLHHLLMSALDSPLVVTSGNRGGEPLALSAEGMDELSDAILDHDRPIARPVDDSVAAVMGGAPRLIRRARGLAPAPLELPFVLTAPVLALGGHQKVTVTLGFGSTAVTSQHLGDMETLANRSFFEQTIADLCRLHGIEPEIVAHDCHPDYYTTMWAERSGRRLHGVQHHHAHLAAALGEFSIEGQALGIIWDGTGYGPDGTIWGGEFLLGDMRRFQRVAWLRPFALPGGELAARQPSRCASGLLAELGMASPHPVSAAPRTTSAGRLFDGVAALLGFAGDCSYEGQAAVYLETCACRAEADAYCMPLRGRMLDWEPALRSLLEQRGKPAQAAARFHNALIQGAAQVARSVGCPRIVLSGGCFQNRLLLEGMIGALSAEGFEVVVPSRFPCNDGGLSLGQLTAAACQLELCQRRPGRQG